MKNRSFVLSGFDGADTATAIDVAVDDESVRIDAVFPASAALLKGLSPLKTTQQVKLLAEGNLFLDAEAFVAGWDLSVNPGLAEDEDREVDLAVRFEIDRV